MAASPVTTLPEEMRGEYAYLYVKHIDWPETRLRVPDFGEGFAELVDSIERQGLQQPIGVKETGGRYCLIWGRRRLEAFRANEDRLGTEIKAVVYPEDLPVEWARVLEIDENLKHQNLTADERAEHTVMLAAEIKSIEELEQVKVKSDFGQTLAEPVKPTPTTGRGHKGIVQKTAERLRVDQAAVRKRAQKVAEVIGEPVDLQKDPPTELTRKAAKFREAAKGPRKPRTKTEPKRETGTFTIGKYTHRYTVPDKTDLMIDRAWLRHAPVKDVAAWLQTELGAERCNRCASYWAYWSFPEMNPDPDLAGTEPEPLDEQTTQAFEAQVEAVAAAGSAPAPKRQKHSKRSTKVESMAEKPKIQKAREIDHVVIKGVEVRQGTTLMADGRELLVSGVKEDEHGQFLDVFDTHIGEPYFVALTPEALDRLTPVETEG